MTRFRHHNKACNARALAVQLESPAEPLNHFFFPFKKAMNRVRCLMMRNILVTLVS